MKRIITFIQAYRKLLLSVGAVCVFVYYMFRVLGILIGADFSTEEVENQVREHIQVIVSDWDQGNS